jgi:hypothetical protein
MLDELIPICRDAAKKAAVELSRLSFGAVDSVKLDSVEEGEDEGERYFITGWRISMSGLHEVVRMVILPEFITEGDGPDWLAEQMSSYIVEQALKMQQTDQAPGG